VESCPHRGAASGPSAQDRYQIDPRFVINCREPSRHSRKATNRRIGEAESISPRGRIRSARPDATSRDKRGHHVTAGRDFLTIAFCPAAAANRVRAIGECQ
jgi:hypothetical protein